MVIDRSRRITFDEVAILYNETRALYPNALVEDILRLSALEVDAARLLNYLNRIADASLNASEPTSKFIITTRSSSRNAAEFRQMIVQPGWRPSRLAAKANC